MAVLHHTKLAAKGLVSQKILFWQTFKHLMQFLNFTAVLRNISPLTVPLPAAASAKHVLIGWSPSDTLTTLTLNGSCESMSGHSVQEKQEQQIFRALSLKQQQQNKIDIIILFPVTLEMGTDQRKCHKPIYKLNSGIQNYLSGGLRGVCGACVCSFFLQCPEPVRQHPTPSETFSSMQTLFFIIKREIKKINTQISLLGSSSPVIKGTCFSACFVLCCAASSGYSRSAATSSPQSTRTS